MVFGKYFDCSMFFYLVCRFVTVLWMLLVIQYLSFLMRSQSFHFILLLISYGFPSFHLFPQSDVADEMTVECVQRE